MNLLRGTIRNKRSKINVFAVQYGAICTNSSLVIHRLWMASEDYVNRRFAGSFDAFVPRKEVTWRDSIGFGAQSWPHFKIARGIQILPQTDDDSNEVLKGQQLPWSRSSKHKTELAGCIIEFNMRADYDTLKHKKRSQQPGTGGRG